MMEPKSEILTRRWLLLKAIEANVRMSLHLTNVNICLKKALEKQTRKYHSLLQKSATCSNTIDDDDDDSEESPSEYQVLPKKLKDDTSSNSVAANSSTSNDCDGGECSSGNDQSLHIKSQSHISHHDLTTSTNSLMVPVNYSTSEGHDGDCEESSSSNEHVLHINSENHIFHEDTSTAANSSKIATDSSASYGEDVNYEETASSSDQLLHGKIENKILHDISTRPNSRMATIGPHTKVHKSVLKSINWKSHAHATRKILMDVFSRRVLATHSLTGKPSPAFPEKPTKKKLDPKLVNDIVNYVVERCPGATISAVRTIITVKCADEAKMMRIREKNCRTDSNSRTNSESYSDSSHSMKSNETIWPMYL